MQSLPPTSASSAILNQHLSTRKTGPENSTWIISDKSNRNTTQSNKWTRKSDPSGISFIHSQPPESLWYAPQHPSVPCLPDRSCRVRKITSRQAKTRRLDEQTSQRGNQIWPDTHAEGGQGIPKENCFGQHESNCFCSSSLSLISSIWPNYHIYCHTSFPTTLLTKETAMSKASWGRSIGTMCPALNTTLNSRSPADLMVPTTLPLIVQGENSLVLNSSDWAK